MNWKNCLEILGNIAAIVTGIVGMYFAIKENSRRVLVRICYGEERIHSVAQTSSGQPVRSLVPGIQTRLINREKLDVNILKFEIKANKMIIGAYPFNFFETRNQTDRLLPSGRNRTAFFCGQEIVDSFLKEPKHIWIRVRVVDETDHIFRSNIIRVAADNLKAQDR